MPYLCQQDSMDMQLLKRPWEEREREEGIHSHKLSHVSLSETRKIGIFLTG